MFLSHWFEFSGIDKVVAPMPTDAKKSSSSETDGNGNVIVDGNSTTTPAAMNEDPENPIWSIVAPRQKPTLIDNNDAKEEQMVTKVPPAEMFRPQQLNVTHCMHCHKLTPISSKVSSCQVDEIGENGVLIDGNEQRRLLQETLQEKEQLQTSYENSARALKDVTKEKRELEEEMEKMRLELEVMKLKIGSDSDCGGGATALQHGGREKNWQPTTPVDDVATSETTPAVASSIPTGSAPHQQPKDEAIDEAEYIQAQVLAAALGTADTLSAPSFVWEKRNELFGRCSALPKKPQKKKNATGGGDVQRSANLKKIIKVLENNPSLVNIRSANMPPLPDGFTLLHAAVHAGNVEVVEYLIQEYVTVDPNHDVSNDRPMIDLNERDLQGRTALHTCADLGHVEVLLVLARAYEDLEAMAEVKNKEESDEEDVEGHVSIAMDKLDTSSIITSSTPVQQPITRSKPKQKSRSPKPPSSLLSAKFSGPTAPIDLSGRTPLGCAATSSAPLTKKNRAQLEKILYKSGDRSIVGERTPPRERSGGLFTPPRSEKKVGFRCNNNVICNSGGESGDVDVIVGSGLTSYLSPTPRKTAGRKATPFHNNLALSSAVNTVPEDIVANSVAWGAADMPGKRIEMEDAILCQYPLDVPPKPLSMDETESSISSAILSRMGIFGVFDGHGDGGFASQFISSNLVPKLQSNPKWKTAYHELNSCISSTTDVVETVFAEAYYDLDDDLKKNRSKPRDGGTTAIVALVSNSKILVANVGDSRCILVKKRTSAANPESEGQDSNDMSQIEVIPMSEDHKPDLPDERARIESAGLEIHTDLIPPSEDDGNGEYQMISRVKKSDREMLGVPRAFGDFDYKSNEDLSSSRQAVVCTPDIVVRDRLDSDDLFLILACDGVWDVMTNDEVGLFVTRGVNAATATLAKEDQPAEADVLATVGDGLLTECLEKGSTDNMSVLIIAFPASGLSFGNEIVTARALAFE